MQVKEAIVLAGGLGPRLQAAVPGIPPSMALINGKPFLAYNIDYYSKQGISKFIFSLGYKHQIITAWLKEHYPSLAIEYAIESDPLDTGGAIQLAVEKTRDKDVLIINGDTFFQVKLDALTAFHTKNASACTIALKLMTDTDRYGVVETDEDGLLQNFKSGELNSAGLVNGGVYLLNTGRFRQQKRPAAFSFEKDYLERFFSAMPMYGCVQDGYFLAIDTPEDLQRAQQELQGLNV